MTDRDREARRILRALAAGLENFYGTDDLDESERMLTKLVETACEIQGVGGTAKDVAINLEVGRRVRAAIADEHFDARRLAGLKVTLRDELRRVWWTRRGPVARWRRVAPMLEALAIGLRIEIDGQVWCMDDQLELCVVAHRTRVEGGVEVDLGEALIRPLGDRGIPSVVGVLERATLAARTELLANKALNEIKGSGRR